VVRDGLGPQLADIDELCPHLLAVGATGRAPRPAAPEEDANGDGSELPVAGPRRGRRNRRRSAAHGTSMSAARPVTRRAGGKDAIAEAWILWVDCDTQESIDELAAFVPEPPIVVHSSRGLHAYGRWPRRRREEYSSGRTAGSPTDSGHARAPSPTSPRSCARRGPPTSSTTRQPRSCSSVSPASASAPPRSPARSVDPPIARGRAVRPLETSSPRTGDPYFGSSRPVYIEAPTAPGQGRLPPSTPAAAPRCTPTPTRHAAGPASRLTGLRRRDSADGRHYRAQGQGVRPGNAHAVAPDITC
jgi:hypothetical protein